MRPKTIKKEENKPKIQSNFLCGFTEMLKNHIQIPSVNGIRYAFGNICNLLVHFITSRFITKVSKVSIITKIYISSVNVSKRKNLLGSSLNLYFANSHE